MDRILRFIDGELEKDKIKAVELMEVPSAPQAKEIRDIYVILATVLILLAVIVSYSITHSITQRASVIFPFNMFGQYEPYLAWLSYRRS